jgi:hypothetical protein
LFRRTLKTKLDVKIFTERKGEEMEHVEAKPNIRNNDEQAKMKMKQYADDKFGARENNLEVADYVLVKQYKTNNLSVPYNPNAMEVVNKKGTMITARNDHRQITRNASHFKEIKTEDDAEDKNDDDSQTQPSPKPPYELRRSRKMPKHLEDYVCDK